MLAPGVKLFLQFVLLFGIFLGGLLTRDSISKCYFRVFWLNSYCPFLLVGLRKLILRIDNDII